MKWKSNQIWKQFEVYFFLNNFFEIHFLWTFILLKFWRNYLMNNDCIEKNVIEWCEKYLFEAKKIKINRFYLRYLPRKVKVKWKVSSWLSINLISRKLNLSFIKAFNLNIKWEYFCSTVTDSFLKLIQY